MNIIKNKHWTITIAAIVLFIFFIYIPLHAGLERRGATVVVTMTDGSQSKGELLAVKNDALLVYDSVADQGKIIGVQHVVQVNVLRKSMLGDGLLSGFVVGLGIVFGTRLSLPGTGTDRELSNLGFPLITAWGGGLLGVLASLPAKFPLAGESFERIQQNLEQLKPYAREQDFEKPAAN